MVKKIASTLLIFASIQSSISVAQTASWQWARSAGSTGADYATANTLDANGNNYSIGWYTSANLTFGSITLTNPGAIGTGDVFVTKHDAAGNAIWAKTFGGIDGEIGSSIAVDNNGDLYITGWFTSSSVTFGNITLNNSSSGSSDIFIVKIDSGGNVIWAKSAGGSLIDRSNGITVDVSGNVFVTGSFMSPSINFGAENVTNSSSSGNDIFVAKYDVSGNNLWVKSAGGSNSDIANSLATDASGNVYITGTFSSPSITFGSTTLSNSSTGTNDLFLVKYNSIGNVFWCIKGGGNSDDVGNSVEVRNNEVYITGGFSSSLFNIGSIGITNTSAGTYDILTAKYDINGNFIWAKGEGGTDSEAGNDIAIDAQDRVFITGYFISNSFKIGGKDLINTTPGYRDIFIVTYDGNGLPAWAIRVGGDNDETGNGISVNPQGNNIIISGVFSSATLMFDNHVIYKGCSDDVLISKLTTGLTIGINDGILEGKLKVYPNPAIDNFYITSEDIGYLEIDNAQGQLVYKTKTAFGTNQIKLNYFEAGVYFIKFTCNGKVRHSKLIVE